MQANTQSIASRRLAIINQRGVVLIRMVAEFAVSMVATPCTRTCISYNEGERSRSFLATPASNVVNWSTV